MLKITRLNRTYCAWLMLVVLLTLAGCGGAPSEPLPTLVVVESAATAVSSPQGSVSSSPTREAVSTPTITQQPQTPLAAVTQGVTAPAATESGTATATFTASRTITNTRTPTITFTATDPPPPDIFAELLATAQQATILPPTYFVGGGGLPGTAVATGVIPPTPDPSSQNVVCSVVPSGGFGALFNTDPTIKQQLGCPVSASNFQQGGAAQNYQFGFMIWTAGVPGYVYVFNANGTFTRYLDSFVEGVDPVSGGEVPPSPDLFEPVRGFGKVWRTYPEVRSSMGWATGGESSGTATTLDFQNGALLNINTRGDILVLARLAFSEGGTWRSAPGAP
jgi:hypothetical protein